ncbi:zinc finger protein [Betafusellovirus yellowstonense]|uniref:Zinc finger protein n=1 Tax=Betafusellovirus yellowstonense TaxID=693629 RepID=D1GFA5_9VIRU|nr:zinc-finger domain protein [Acidianus spindle-shaped virus 1]ACZ35806.1 zinc finger protein [Acidianus spindle-shaped virus 1]
MFKCPVCEFETTTIFNIKRHVRMHDFDRCPVCGQKLNGNSPQQRKLALTSHCAHFDDADHLFWWWLVRSSHDGSNPFPMYLRKQLKRRLEC